MSQRRSAHGSGGRSSYAPPSRQVRAPSLDTNASGIAFSTISNAESLSAFPTPPSSIPPTPIRPGFITPSQATFSSSQRTVYAVGLHTAFKPGSTHESPGTDSNPLSSESSERRTQRSASTVSHPISAFDWHEGASSIDVDAAEGRLLPTSFITSLLQENSKFRRAQHTSHGSDAISGISGMSGMSEMTYPPLFTYSENNPETLHPARHSSTIRRPLPQKPQATRIPPSSFQFVPEASGRKSGDSATLYSLHDQAQPLRTVNGMNCPTSDSGIVTSDRLTIHDPLSIGYKVNLDSRRNDKTLPSTLMTESSSLRLNSQSAGRQSRNSVHSTKSTSSSFLSRISSRMPIHRALTWRRTKPLPPVPIIPRLPNAAESEHSRVDEATPLPDLVNRAHALHGLLEKGYHPHESLSCYYSKDLNNEGLSDTETFKTEYTTSNGTEPLSYRGPPPNRRNPTFNGNGNSLTPLGGGSKTVSFFRQNKRTCIIAVVLLFTVLAVAIGLGVTAKQKTTHKSACSENSGGPTCNLNACVCVSPTANPSGRCDSLAQEIINLIPSLNVIFNSNVSTSSVYNTIWLVQGSPPAGNCKLQSDLVNVAPYLDAQALPNRTQWAQTALLWNFLETQDTSSSKALTDFVADAPWHLISHADGVVADNSSQFSIFTSGYIFDFANQTVTAPPLSFNAADQPVTSQIQQGLSQQVLDRMYSFAVASSTQRENALKLYWSNTISLPLDQLTTFRSALSRISILLPFDATSQVIRNLYTGSGSPSSFPPPIACYPDLNSSQAEAIQTVEENAFGLQPMISKSNQFDTNCFSNHPVYGVLDILRLRLPFNDSSTGTVKQAAVLQQDAGSRAIIYCGQILSGMPAIFATDSTSNSKFQFDARRLGFLNNMNHVILEYLSSMTPDLARAVIQYVINTSTANAPSPPNNSTIIPQSFQSIPVLEVAVFGAIGKLDIASAVSSFSTASGGLFFGSGDGDSFRNWAINNTVGGSIAWTENAFSPSIVRDSSSSDSLFNQIWGNASLGISRNDPHVGVSNITASFNSFGKYGPG